MKTPFEQGRADAASLVFQLPRRALSGAVGDHFGSGTGSSLEFQDFREYRAGDDIRRLDWAAYARTDKLNVRLYRDEIQPKVDLILDSSASMACPSACKADSARYLAGLLAESVFHSYASLAFWTFGSQGAWIRHFPYRVQLPEQDFLPEFEGDSSASEGFSRTRHLFSRNSVRIIVSDFLWQTDPGALIREWAENAGALILIQLLEKEELDPDFSGAWTLTDSETSDLRSETIVDSLKIKQYQARLKTHLELWRTAAGQYGAEMVLITAGNKGVSMVETLVSREILCRK